MIKRSRLPRRGLLTLLALLVLCGCTQRAEPQLSPEPEVPQALSWDALEYERSLELLYAEQFSVEYYTNGYQKIAIGDGNRYLVVPEGAEVPFGVPEEVTVLRQPLDSIYLVATSAMDLFRQLDAIDTITLAGLNADGWYIEEAREAMEAGRMVFAGKYGAPDYERILDLGCDLAVESTMIYHNPEVKEQLERLGVPVLVERSSYESHPLGRMEWIKLYASLLGKEAEAADYFDGLMERLAPILEQENTGKTVAFFYITSAGTVNVRRSGDYIAKSIGLAGGVYAFPDLESGEGAKSTMNMQMESFYEGARNTDILIYNSAIDGELQTVDQLLEKSGILADFKAVQEGNVWCTGKNLFQESLGLGDLITDLYTILSGENAPLTYLHHLD
ncbi:MAG: ABC transporter substrate-binding protein [Oscillibacter sp.]|jgi:iron complex transport system substrate-binding protein|nr:ABC transporter substrate-binding protein [uncultured Oscillibacter sp.]MCI8811856.1 ABC transporter substrate-binding protein [Oscillibacter sp.]